MVAMDVFITVISLVIASTQAIIAYLLFRLIQKIHSNEIKVQRLLKVQEWGNECIDSLAEADHFFAPDEGEISSTDDRERRNHLLARLSALIDRG